MEQPQQETKKKINNVADWQQHLNSVNIFWQSNETGDAHNTISSHLYFADVGLFFINIVVTEYLTIMSITHIRKYVWHIGKQNQ